MVEIFFYTDFVFNFLQEYIDQDNHVKVRNVKQIATSYFQGWFFIDFVSIFPFNVFFSTGVVTKLVRLCRLPRLIKLIDISRFSKLLKSFEKEGGGDDQWIVQQYFILYIYNICRLIIIALMITYFIGCIIYFISGELNTEQDRTEGKTFIQEFGLGDLKSDTQRVILCCYFALTMLSTVGYGDYYPISDREKVASVIIMLACVAIFSFIMNSFMEII